MRQRISPVSKITVIGERIIFTVYHLVPDQIEQS